MSDDIDPDFEKWFYNARDPATNMPYGTHLLYKVCDNDGPKFDEGVRLLEIAFEAGRDAEKLAAGAWEDDE